MGYKVAKSLHRLSEAVSNLEDKKKEVRGLSFCLCRDLMIPFERIQSFQEGAWVLRGSSAIRFLGRVCTVTGLARIILPPLLIM